MNRCHPYFMATVAINLYLYGQEGIEAAAYLNIGVTEDKMQRLANNKIAYSNLVKFLELIEDQEQWPRNWPLR